MQKELPKYKLYIKVSEGKQYEVSYYLLKQALFPGLDKRLSRTVTEKWAYVTETVTANTFSEAKRAVKSRLETEGKTARSFIVREVNADVAEGTV